MKTTPGIGVHVGINMPDRDTGIGNKKGLGESYAAQVITLGFRVYLRNDALEGRRFQLFVNRVDEDEDEDDRLRNDRPRSVARSRKLERCDLMLKAIFDLLPIFFASGWRLLPRGRR
ncbi:MAG: hypothetical protein K8F91_07810 [Candidatus Obscuribacterales bacterium]|nr:hypothetical protein [Candidatus Obscuribacterales bacterium]